MPTIFLCGISASAVAISIGTFDATSAAGAAISVDASGVFTYDPTTSASLFALGSEDSVEDTFSYTVIDSNGGVSDPVTVTITVTGELPVAQIVVSDGDTVIMNSLISEEITATDADDPIALDGRAKIRWDDTPGSVDTLEIAKERFRWLVGGAAGEGEA